MVMGMRVEESQVEGGKLVARQPWAGGILEVM